MATFESVTYALEHTPVFGSEGEVLGNALQLIAGATGIAGEIPGAGGDQQFRVFADLKAGAIEGFRSNPDFKASRNKHGPLQLYHHGFPDSFRQDRFKNRAGYEAGLQPSYDRKKLKSDIDIDYRFFPFHNFPANSDVRAEGN